MNRFVIDVESEEKRVSIEADDNAEFIDWMMACEFLIHKTAQLSNAGYEKALELLCKGALTYQAQGAEGD